jgi:hypothetical protein
MGEDRREALKIIGAISATCTFPFPADELYAQHADHPGAGQAAALPSKASFFGERDFKTVTRLADLIIPATKTPGAVAAGVPFYIDMVVGRNEEAKKLYRDGLAWLDASSRKKHGKPFVDLSERQQIAMLTPLSAEADQLHEPPDGPRRLAGKRARPKLPVAFFRAVKSMTADGFFTSREGLVETLGYKGNSVLSEFPSCVHEH